MRYHVLGLAALATATLLACDDGGGDEPSRDTDVPDLPTNPIEGDEFEQIPRSEEGPGAGTEGADVATPFSSGVRLGQFAGGTPIITGPEARCRQGDWILQNQHLTACISGSVSTDQLQFTGGRIIDLVPTSDPTGDVLDVLGPALGLLEATGDELRVISDGSDGIAVLRTTGIDMPLKLLVGTLNTDILTRPIHVVTETEYRLGVETPYIEMVTWVRLVGDELAEFQLGEGAFPGDKTILWTWPRGMGSPGAGQPLDAYAFVGFDRSVMVYGQEPMRVPGIDATLLSPSIFASYSLSGMLGNLSEAGVVRYVTVGTGSTAEMREHLAEILGDEAPAGHEVTLTAAARPGWEGSRWAIHAQEGAAMELVSVRPGQQRSVRLPSGAYTATPLDWPWASEPFDFEVTGVQTVELPAPDAVAISISCKPEGRAVAPACRVDYAGSASGQSFQPQIRPLLLPRGFTGSLVLSLGETYESRELVFTDLTEDRSEQIELEELFDRDGWVAGDLHQHSMRSADSAVLNSDRVYSNIGAGVDLMAATDHDIVENYAGVLESLGLTGAIHLLQGVEISPLKAHMNAFPIQYGSGDGHAGGAPPLAVRDAENPRRWRQQTMEELAVGARDYGATFIQINHPRGATSSLFDHVAYDPVTGGPTRRSEEWPSEFHAIEIFNRPSAMCELLRDWFGMLRHGHRVTGTGNSDTHNLRTPAGWPRNYIHLDGKPLTTENLLDAARAGRVSVSGSIFIDFDDAYFPGDEVTMPSAGTFELPLRVQSAAWAGVDGVVVFVNGIEVFREELTNTPEDVVDFDQVVELELTEDAFIVAFAYGNQEMQSVTRGRRPFGFTNPIYVDVGGNGWTAPGVSGPEDVPMPTGLPSCPAARMHGPMLQHSHGEELVSGGTSEHDDHDHHH